MGAEAEGKAASGRTHGPAGPPPEIIRKLRMLAIPALMVFFVGVVLLASQFTTPRAERSEPMFYFATALTFGSLIVLFPAIKVWLLWPRDSRPAPKRKRTA